MVLVDLGVTSWVASIGETTEGPIWMGEPNLEPIWMGRITKKGKWVFLTPEGTKKGQFLPKNGGGKWP